MYQEVDSLLIVSEDMDREIETAYMMRIFHFSFTAFSHKKDKSAYGELGGCHAGQHEIWMHSVTQHLCSE